MWFCWLKIFFQAIEKYIVCKYPDFIFSRGALEIAIQKCIRGNLVVHKHKNKFKLAAKPEAAIRSRSAEGAALVHSSSDLLQTPDAKREPSVQRVPSSKHPAAQFDWAFNMGTKTCSIFANQDFVYAGDESGSVVKLAREDGKQLLHSRLSASVKCMVEDDGFLFAGTNDGCLYDLTLFERPRLLAKLEDFPQMLWLDIHEGKMVASDSEGQVAMVDYAGQTIWKRKSSDKDGWMVRVDDTGECDK